MEIYFYFVQSIFFAFLEGREKRRWEIEWEREGLIQNDEQRERERAGREKG